MEPISIHNRETIVKHKQANKSGREITQWLMIHQQTVSRIWQLFLTTDNVAPKPKNSGRKPKITPQTIKKNSTKNRTTTRHYPKRINQPIHPAHR